MRGLARVTEQPLLVSSIVRLAMVAPSSARSLIGNRYSYCASIAAWENSRAGLRPLARRKRHRGHKPAAALAIVRRIDSRSAELEISLVKASQSLRRCHKTLPLCQHCRDSVSTDTQIVFAFCQCICHKVYDFNVRDGDENANWICKNIDG